MGHAAAGSREDILRLLIRLKSSIETGLSLSRFMQLHQELDEAVQFADVTKSREVSVDEIRTAKLLVLHLARVGKLWLHVNDATTCRDLFRRYRLDSDCVDRLNAHLSQLGTSHVKLNITGISMPPDEIIGKVLAEANKEVSALVASLAKPR